MTSHRLILAVLMMSTVAVGAIRSEWTSTATTIPDFKWRVRKMEITNSLEGKQNLEVHCKDKNTDFGVQEVPFGTTYRFTIRPNTFSADYFCSFVFDNVVHWFDIYLWKRDYFHNCGEDDKCKWSVNQARICSTESCYSWNPPATSRM